MICLSISHEFSCESLVISTAQLLMFMWCCERRKVAEFKKPLMESLGRVQVLDVDVCILLRANALGKGRHLTALPPAKGKQKSSFTSVW